MPTLKVLLANCPIVGEKFTVHPDGTHRRNLIEIKLSGAAIRIYQTRDGMRDKIRELNDATIHTTTIDFGDVPPSRRRYMEHVAEDLAWLLSLATVSPVVPFKYEYGETWRAVAVSKKMTYYRPLIDRADGAIVSKFLETTWQEFRRMKQRRRLPAVIDYIVHALHPDQPLEVQALLAFTALDSLKWTRYRLEGNFRKHVESMLLEVGMRRSVKRLVDVRNRIVHRGLAEVPHRLLSNYNDRLHDLVREYMLRLLKYRGPFGRYSGRLRTGHIPQRRRYGAPTTGS